MSTRSTIALEFTDGTVRQVYCHWDGYLEHNGEMLMNHWTDPAKVEALVNGGDISGLAPEIGAKHEFGNPHPYNSAAYDAWNEKFSAMVTFYGRDRGETGVEARQFANFQDYCDNHSYEEFEYILRRDGQWYVNTGDGEGYQPLCMALSAANQPD